MAKAKELNSRLDIRVNEETKRKAEKAYLLLGLKSLTEYVTKLIEENAEEVIREHESITVSKDIFDNFLEACQDSQPNQALQDISDFAKSKGF